jgi:hypothetical protein
MHKFGSIVSESAPIKVVVYILKPFNLKSHRFLIPAFGSFRLVLKWTAKLVGDQASTTWHGRCITKTSSTESNLTSLWRSHSQDSEDVMWPLEAHHAWCFQPWKSIGIITVLCHTRRQLKYAKSPLLAIEFSWAMVSTSQSVTNYQKANFPTTW